MTYPLFFIYGGSGWTDKLIYATAISHDESDSDNGVLDDE